MNALVPRLSVIVPCRNEIDHIDAFLKSIVAQEPIEGGIEVIVADGMSEDGTRERVERFAEGHPEVRFVDNPELFTSFGLNHAIRESRGSLVLRLDVHTRYASDYVRQCVATLEETGADNVGGAARTIADSYVQRANALAYASPFSVGGARFHDPEYEGWVDTVPYGCWRRETLDRVGLFDESLVRNQDDEHNLRITRAGGRIWQSRRIRSWYSPRGSIAAISRQYMQYGYWKVLVIRKHHLPASWRHVVPAIFLLAFLAACLSALVDPGLVFLPVGMAGAYVAASAIASLAATGVGRRAVLLPVLPAVFAAYHLGYGIGFLLGVARVVRGLTSRPGFDTTTR